MSYGFVANFICFPAVQKIENRLRFDKVTESLKVGTFFETQCMLLINKCMRKTKHLAQGCRVTATRP